jgi:hypothetical protein
MRITDRVSAGLIFPLATVALLVLSSCGSTARVSIPTLSVDAIFTGAAQTFVVQRATDLALTPPSQTPALSPFPTLAPPLPFATMSFDSPTPGSNAQSNCDDAAYAGDITIPDGTLVDAGRGFVKSWLMQNTGTCAWTPGYKLTFVDGEPMSGRDSYVNIAVPVGRQAKVSVYLIAPNDAGSFYGRWQLKNESGRLFGSRVSVSIKVADSLLTATP